MAHAPAADSYHIGRITINVADRLFEWVATFIMLVMAALLVLPGVVFTGAFAIAESHGYDWLVNTVLAFCGCFRGAALVANGNVPIWGPKMRCYSAMAAGQLWLLFCGSLIYDAFTTGKVSLGIACYAGLLLGELRSVGRATRDGARIC